jgi:hypothetical protein
VGSIRGAGGDNWHTLVHAIGRCAIMACRGRIEDDAGEPRTRGASWLDSRFRAEGGRLRTDQRGPTSTRGCRPGTQSGGA